MSAIQSEFERQRDWIAGCDDPQEVLDKMREYRDAQRNAIQNDSDLGRARCADLLELAEDRVVELKAARMRAQAAETPTTAVRAADTGGGAEVRRLRDELAARDRRDREAAELRASERDVATKREREGREARDRQRAADERDRGRRDEARAAAARVANARAAEIEARTALLRQGAALATRAAPRVSPVERGRPVAAPPRQKSPTTHTGSASTAGSGRPPASTARSAAPLSDRVRQTQPIDRRDEPNNGDQAINEADRLALASLGRFPPTAEERQRPSWKPDADWPAEWSITGFDLSMFRGRINVTQKVLSGQLEVPVVEVVRAESRPKDKVRPALQVAVRRAIDEFRAANRRVASVGEAMTVTTPLPMAVGARVTTAGGGLVGADLARLRVDRGLSQREAAVLLGVAHGTIAKGELAPAKALGEQLQTALREALRGRR